jgi:hypothetical protein
VTTLVISIRDRVNELGPQLQHAPNLIYIGKANARGRTQGLWDLRQHVLHNPHKVGDEGRKPQPCGARGCRGLNVVHSRVEAVAAYGRRLLAHPELLAEVPALRGKTLGCWCAPQLCHGHILSVLAEVPELEHRRLLQELVADPWGALPAAV